MRSPKAYGIACACAAQHAATIEKLKPLEIMSQKDKLLAKILLGASDADIPFAQLRRLLGRLGFDERIRGSHHIFTKEGIEEILNLQPKQEKLNSIKLNKYV